MSEEVIKQHKTDKLPKMYLKKLEKIIILNFCNDDVINSCCHGNQLTRRTKMFLKTAIIVQLCACY